VNVKHKLIYPVVAIIGVISFGTIGYTVVEQWTFFDSLYMTIITLTTVGYEEVHALSKAGRIFSMILILVGVGTMLYALGVGAKIILGGEIRDILGRRQLRKKSII
jgi:voltage-gated potassium channel